MYFDDHPPPHFHAIYGQYEAQLGINPIVVLQGNLPRRAESMVIEWAALHQQQLIANWQLLHNDQSPQKIEPLE